VSVRDIGLEELSCGTLAAIFSAGAAAVVVHCGEEMRRLWAVLMENADERLPWEASLFDLVRNYHGCEDITTTLGDMFYIQPGAHGYYARKFEILRHGQNGTPCVMPPVFWQPTGAYRMPEATISECCMLADRIAAAFVPDGLIGAPYRVAVQRLKYHASAADYRQLAGITANALGRWGRLGFRVDAHRQMLARPLKARGLSDALGWMMAMPPLCRLAAGLNGMVASHDRQRNIAEGDWLIEGPHYDERFFTALSGDRSNVRSEVFWNGTWLPLPISRETITVFPGNLAEQAFGLRATCHRVVLEQHGHDAPPSETRTTNTTLLLGAV